jgi:hypothetical protein
VQQGGPHFFTQLNYFDDLNQHSDHFAGSNSHFFTQLNYFDDPNFISEQLISGLVNNNLTFTDEPAFNPDINNLRDPLGDFSPSPPRSSSHQVQQFSFQGQSISEASHSSTSQHCAPAVGGCDFAQAVNEYQLDDELGIFSFQFDTNFDTIIPTATVQQPSAELSNSIISNRDSLSFSAPDNEPPVGANSRERGSSPADSPSALSLADGIQCTWPSCSKVFPSIHVYKFVDPSLSLFRVANIPSHHFKNHSRPFQCVFCPARHATKRQRDRHVNERHNNTEGYYCSMLACPRSLASGGKPFPRIENCRRHMVMVHKFSAEQARSCDMDEETRRVRAGRKIGRQVGV